jgi:hypothetical protein
VIPGQGRQVQGPSGSTSESPWPHSSGTMQRYCP